ncbi:hypothetical protein JCM19037_2615 [Geomicrobium sp. JCM 19037]|uniref:hypothetical protein n=1 Tax=Geomicrobium sp. JCM 19037 TaxID=1460634 RepID=UPI00045F36D8|nr:hypothetical protein [Geomicrobium sp. JCM 19037]GAK04227.1 hypothetical protein JCM19037_2615 [Geomicrobium sp. JCM 19037]
MMYIWILILGLTTVELNPVAWKHGMKRNTKAWLAFQALRYVFGLVLSFYIVYFQLLDLSWSGILNTFGFVVAINLILSGLFLGAARVPKNSKEAQLQAKKAIKNVPSAIGGTLLVGLLFMNFVFPFTVTEQLSELGDIETSSEQIESVTEEAVRAVPYTYARYKSEIVFGNIDNFSFYDLGESTIQKINDELYWVSPIEYANLWRWWRADSAPGYIMVSAEDPNAEAQLVSDHEMTYVPSAFFGDNLERHVRQAYEDVILVGYSFEPDDDGHPYYAYSYAYYDYYRTGPRADGVIVIDAVTGEMEKFALGDQPDFIDNAIDYRLALQYADWFGRYSNGLLNAWFAKEGVHEPTSNEEMIGVLGPDDEMYWMIDHMRPNQDSNTMVGFTMVNAQTGEATYYTGSSGLLNARGAREVVNKSFVREQWSGTQPVLYSVYDHYTWVVPVVDQNGLMREMAMVHAETGNIAYASSREEAFNEYRQLLASSLGADDYVPTDIYDEETVEGEIYRISDTFNNQYIQALMTGETRVLEFDITSVSDAVFIQEGDEIEATVIDTDENILQVIEFNNLTIDDNFGEIEEFIIDEEDLEEDSPAENEEDVTEE